MQKLEQIYEGKAKKVFKTDDPELLIVDYKDDATAFNGLKKGTIKGKGVQHVQRGGRGDQLVKVSIEVPTNLSKKQKDALQAFESTLEDKNYSRRASFFDKLKDLFK